MKTGTTTRFEVYELAWDSFECTPLQKSKEVLAKAKAAFKKASLDISRKPKAILPHKDEFKLDGVKVKWVSSQLGSPKGLEEIGRVQIELRLDTKKLYQRTTSYSLGGAADDATLRFHSAYATDAGFVFVEEKSSLVWGTGYLSYTLSPPIRVP